MTNKDKPPIWLRELDDGTSAVREGAAELLFDKDKVFYNPIQEFNRDLSIAAIQVWSQEFLEEKRKKGKKNPVNSMVNDFERIEELSEKQQIRRSLQKQYLLKASEDVADDVKSLTDPLYDNYSFTVLEALAASGLRSCRYAKEIPRIKSILTNDLSSDAVESIAKNAKHNNVDSIIRPNKDDACQVFYKALAEKKRYDVVDLDPYGSAAPFLDAAVQVVSDGGLLCVTCTDTAVLAGSQPESCFGKYGGLNVPNAPYTHELALRILLHSIQSTAAKYKLGVEVLLSCSIDYYVRVFVRIRHSAILMKEASSKTALVNACQTCNSFVIQPLGKLIKTNKGRKYGPHAVEISKKCTICDSVTHIAGPFYSDPIHDRQFVSKMMFHVAHHEKQYGTWERMAGMLTVISEELHDYPLYFVLPKMCNVIHCQTPSLPTFMSAILSLGFKVSSSHACQQSIKTNAPPSVLWDIIKHWVKKTPLNGTCKETTPSFRILSVEPKIMEVSFERRSDDEPLSVKHQMLRYQCNPTPFWGPQAKPGQGKIGKPGETKKDRKRKAEQEIEQE